MADQPRPKLIALCGHIIGDQIRAVAIFQVKPNKQQLFNTGIFEDNEKDNQLLDILVQHNHVATAKNNVRYYEYQFMDVPENGSLNFNDYLYTGYLDWSPELWVHY